MGAKLRFSAFAIVFALLSACTRSAAPEVYRDEESGMETTYDSNTWEKVEAFGSTALSCSGGDCKNLMCRLHNDLPGFSWPADTSGPALQAVDVWLLEAEKSAGGKTAKTVEQTHMVTLGNRPTLVNVMTRQLIDGEPSAIVYLFQSGEKTSLLKCNGSAKSVAAARTGTDALAAAAKIVTP